MKKQILAVSSLFLVIVFVLTGCTGHTKPTETTDRDTLYQTALLQSLMLGDYYGSVRVGTLKQCGDIGIGTFDKLNGELIMLDGHVYAGLSDGTLQEMRDDVTVPFSDVTFFDADKTIRLTSVSTMDDLKNQMTDAIKDSGTNYFYMIRIDGTFRHVEYRSEFAQEEPYKPLAEVMKTDQVLFSDDNTTGTIVGLYCPDYMDGLNTPGWHFHFLTSDHKTGGHLLNVVCENVSASIDKTTGFSMSLPEEPFFKGIDLTTDLKEDIGKVEQNK